MIKMTCRYTEESAQLQYESHDNCVLCGHEFKEGETIHLGYNLEKTPLYLCDNCSSELDEVCYRIFFSKRRYLKPDKETKLWRYVDIYKYLSMLLTGGLYFSRADAFYDTFEGAKGIRRRKHIWDEFYVSFFMDAISHPPDGVEFSKSDEEKINQAKKLLLDLEKAGKISRQQTYINCWHANDSESEAMWKAYSNSIPNALAIQTTYEKLYDIVGKPNRIDIGYVDYIDFGKKFVGVNESFWKKRKSFEYEREVRAVITKHNSSELGLLVHCDLSKLIENVYISPYAPSWIVQIINDLNNKYDCKLEVLKSSLVEAPFY